MKAIILLATLVLISLASAASPVVDSSIYGPGYAYWMNLVLYMSNAGSWMSCLAGSWIVSIWTNDGGYGFYSCLN